jgi:quercetin dioxygenase-like cupin family protein
MPTDSLLELAAGASAAGRVVSVERTDASGFMPPLHAHPADEAVHVVEGSLTIFAGHEVVSLDAGHTFVVAGGVAHTFRVESRQARAIFATLTGSAGRYEDFLRATGPVALDSAGAPIWARSEDASATGAVAAAAGVSLVGPPGALPAGVRIAARAA